MYSGSVWTKAFREATWLSLANHTSSGSEADFHNSEALYEDESFPERELAALVASKTYYQLQEYNESMVFALGAGKLFEIDNPGEYEDTIIGMSRTSTKLLTQVLTWFVSSQMRRYLHLAIRDAQSSLTSQYS